MAKRFKIEFRRSGMLFECKYADTIKGAIKSARSKGWADFEHYLDLSPAFALISERVEGGCPGWELVATLSAKGIETEDNMSRPSVKRAMAAIDKARGVIELAGQTMSGFNAIADKEYAAEQKAAKS